MSIFQTKEYLDIFVRHFVPDKSTIAENIFEILPGKRAVLLGMKHVLNGQEITDYGNIINPSQEALTRIIKNLTDSNRVSTIQFDYIREDAAIFQLLQKISPEPPQLQEVSPYIVLPNSWEDYLEMLDKVEKKELKRKVRRLETVKYEFQVEVKSPQEVLFQSFIELHKLSDHRKNQFMSNEMTLFFKELFMKFIPGWQQKLAFLFINNEPAASVFYFENEEEILLYNSGYNPEQKYYSPGLLLIAHLIKFAIENRKKRFDFLRGGERYKYDLGGKDTRLFQFIFKPSYLHNPNS